MRKLTFGYCNLAVDLMTFTSELDLDIVVTNLHAKNWVNKSSGSKVIIRKIMKLLAAVTLQLTMTFTSELDLDIVVT